MLIEIVTFQLVEGADEYAFVAADAAVQTEFFSSQPGAVRRTTARGADGRWLVLRLWASEAHANAAVIASEKDESFNAFMTYVDRGTLSSERFTDLGG